MFMIWGFFMESGEVFLSSIPAGAIEFIACPPMLSGRRESNPPHLPWQGSILPMNYSRMCLEQESNPHNQFFRLAP